jgi:hypothetical protein
MQSDAVALELMHEVGHSELEGTYITHMSMGRVSYAPLVSTRDGLVRNFETQPMEVIWRFTGAMCARFHMEAGFSPYAKFVYAGSDTDSVVLWTVRKREAAQVAQWTGKLTQPVMSIAWSPVKDTAAFTSFAPGHNILRFDAGDNPAVRLRARKVRECTRYSLKNSHLDHPAPNSFREVVFRNGSGDGLDRVGEDQSSEPRHIAERSILTIREAVPEP